MADKSTFVKQELLDFLKAKSSNIEESEIDEIVLSYMVSILEELGEETSSDDAFDVEAFTDMMEAYIPGFGEIDCVAVSEWMFSLSSKLANLNSSQPPVSDIQFRLDTLSLRHEPASDQQRPQVCRQRTSSSTSSSSVSDPGQGSRSASSRHSSTSEGEPITTDMTDEAPESSLAEDEHVQALLEMFPGTSTMELAHCLCISHGHVDSAAQLLLYRQEAGESITEESQADSSKKKPSTKQVDKAVKDQILNRYGFVDTADDERNHRPVGPKQQPKKMVRYLDGQVVSTKGERFTEVKKQEDEAMKKTYVNLKPARKYRFH